MPAYFIADIRIHAPEGHKRYLDGVMEIFERYGGQLRAVSSAKVETIKGTWRPQGLVLLEFPNLAQVKAWKNDPDYVELAKTRQATTETHMVLVEGV